VDPHARPWQDIEAAKSGAGFPDSNIYMALRGSIGPEALKAGTAT